jgi:hypothetical protein
MAGLAQIVAGVLQGDLGVTARTCAQMTPILGVAAETEGAVKRGASVMLGLVALVAAHALKHTALQVATLNARRRHAMVGVCQMAHASVLHTSIAAVFVMGWL